MPLWNTYTTEHSLVIIYPKIVKNNIQRVSHKRFLVLAGNSKVRKQMLLWFVLLYRHTFNCQSSISCEIRVEDRDAMEEKSINNERTNLGYNQALFKARNEEEDRCQGLISKMINTQWHKHT